MKKYIIACCTSIGILIYSYGFCQSIANKSDYNCICWSENVSLQRTDFKYDSIPPEVIVNEYIVAVSSLRLSIIPISNYGKFSFIVCNIFDINCSWISKDLINTDNIIIHEKLHFDIAEIFTRKLRWKLMESLSPNGYNNVVIDDIIDEIAGEKDKMQRLFDEETSFGIGVEKQEEWKNKIKKKLDDLAEYSHDINYECPCKSSE